MTGEIRSLTGLRGFAACLVMLYHFTVLDPVSGPLDTILHKGYIWVDLFFVLSGFVMALTYSHLFADSNGWRAYRTFLSRRIARIYPLYLLITLETASLYLFRTVQVHPGTHFLPMLAANVTMIQGWGLAPSFEGSAWSISTEWAAYLIFPLLIAATISSSRRVAFACGAVAVASILAIAALPGTLAMPDEGRFGPLDIFSPATPVPILRCVAEFTLGLLSYRVSQWLRDTSTLSMPWVARRNLPSIILVGAIVWLMTVHNSDVVLVIALFPLLLLSLFTQDSLVSRFLGSTIPYWLGELSYSIYLIHSKFQRFIEWADRALAQVVPHAHNVAIFLAVMLVGVCASFTYYGIERPMRKLLRLRLSSPPSLQRAASN
jgi:peptidoglycan/LPS O-acetylase OafA/YrhL